MRYLNFILFGLLIFLISGCKEDNFCQEFYTAKIEQCTPLFSPDRLPKVPGKDKSYKRLMIERKLGFKSYYN